MKPRNILIALMLCINFCVFGLQPSSTNVQNQSLQQTVEQQEIIHLKNEMATYRDDVRNKIQELDEQESRWTTLIVFIVTLIVGSLGIIAPYLFNLRNEKEMQRKLDEATRLATTANEQSNKAINALKEIERIKKDIEEIKNYIAEKSDETTEAAEKTKDYFSDILSDYYINKYTTSNYINYYTKNLNPNDPSLGSFRALILLNDGKNEEALEAINEALNNDPSSEMDLLIRASIFMAMKKYEKALSDYSQIIKLNPESKVAYLQRAKCYRSLAKKETDMTKKEFYLNQAKLDEEKANLL